jgi:hypothetical protein
MAAEPMPPSGVETTVSTEIAEFGVKDKEE